MKHYDEYVNKVLQEACFGNSHEKLTGIKRQGAFFAEADAETQGGKMALIELAAGVVSGMFQDRQDSGNPIEKKELAEMSLAVLRHYNAEEGHEITLADIKVYFKEIKDLTGVMPMTGERYRNIEKGAIKKAGGELKKRMKHGGGGEQGSSGEQSVVAKHGMSSGEMAKLRGSGMVS